MGILHFTNTLVLVHHATTDGGLSHSYTVFTACSFSYVPTHLATVTEQSDKELHVTT
jgi:hypothetical protein